MCHVQEKYIYKHASVVMQSIKAQKNNDNKQVGDGLKNERKEKL